MKMCYKAQLEIRSREGRYGSSHQASKLVRLFTKQANCRLLIHTGMRVHAAFNTCGQYRCFNEQLYLLIVGCMVTRGSDAQLSQQCRVTGMHAAHFAYEYWRRVHSYNRYVLTVSWKPYAFSAWVAN